MRALDAGDILELVDRGDTAGPARRALLVLDAAFPEVGGATAAAALSHRDRALLAVRSHLFGPSMLAQAECDGCGLPLELALTAADVGLQPVEPTFPPAPTTTIGDGVVVRAVTGGDAAHVEGISDPEEARDGLLARVAPGLLAADAEPGGTLDETLEALDPAADVELTLDCPECGGSTLRGLDVPRFVWKELAASAPRIMADVADLAREFHWSERDILSLPAERRAYYLVEARA